jgi:hypothetical protein
MAQIKHIDSKFVVEFWRRMCKHYGTSFHYKSNSKFMKAVSIFLAMTGINRKKFLNNYYTVINGRIYCPRKLGTGDRSELFDQISTCMHEHMHVIQEKKEPRRYKWKYALSTASRAHYECAAYRTDFEFTFWDRGKTPSMDWVVSSLKDYALKDRDIKTVTKYLKSSLATINSGGIMSPTVKQGIKIIKEMIEEGY